MAPYLYTERVGAGPDAPLLVLLHGTGGDETQFIELGRGLLPEARLVAPRGDVSEGGMLRFFRRRGEGIYDMADLARATDKLADFVAERAGEGKPAAVLGFGYSNGANILASVLMAHPGLFSAAALLHPLIPFEPAPVPALSGTPVLITAGRRDPIGPAPLTEGLAGWFGAQGAEVALHWHEGGHELRPSEIEATREFFARLEPAPGARQFRP